MSFSFSRFYDRFEFPIFCFSTLAFIVIIIGTIIASIISYESSKALEWKGSYVICYSGGEISVAGKVKDYLYSNNGRYSFTDEENNAAIMFPNSCYVFRFSEEEEQYLQDLRANSDTTLNQALSVVIKSHNRNIEVNP